MIFLQNDAVISFNTDLIRPRNREKKDAHEIAVKKIILDAASLLFNLRIVLIQELL